MMILKNFLLHHKLSIREALVKIGENGHGLVFAIDDGMRLLGVATDGDIRRALLGPNISLESPIDYCINREFVFASSNTAREVILKQLDNRIKAIPVLDELGCLIDVITGDSMLPPIEQQVCARSRSPARLSFGGGGSDLTHFFQGEDGAVINTTLAIYSHALLRIRGDQRINIYSQDLGENLYARDLSGCLEIRGRFGLIQSVLKLVNPCFGFDLYLYSDFPVGSGLGGSAVVASAILGCFNQFRRDQWDAYQLAELAFQAERINLGVAGGWQDQYATIFGGFNFMEFKMEQNLIYPLRVNRDVVVELEENLILCDTGLTHSSGDIHSIQKKEFIDDVKLQKVRKNVELTYLMRDHLLRGNLKNFAKCMDDAWALKRDFSQEVSNSRLNEIYKKAMDNGASGGKLMGAGGGGFFAFYATPFVRQAVEEALISEGLSPSRCHFESEGLRSWLVRE